MKRESLASPDVILVALLVFGAALTVFGGWRLLRDSADVEAQTAFGIGFGILFPLAAIIALRLLGKQQDERPPQ